MVSHPKTQRGNEISVILFLQIPLLYLSLAAKQMDQLSRHTDLLAPFLNQPSEVIHT